MHGAAKSGWGIGKAEVHDRRFVKSERSFECGLPPIFLFDAYVVVSPSDVELGKEGLALKAFDDISDKGKGIVVSYCPLV